MVSLSWMRMTIGLLVLAGGVGHIMQNGETLASNVFGIELGSPAPMVGTREPRLVQFQAAQAGEDAAIPGRDDAVRRMPAPLAPASAVQPGLSVDGGRVESRSAPAPCKGTSGCSEARRVELDDAAAGSRKRPVTQADG